MAETQIAPQTRQSCHEIVQTAIRHCSRLVVDYPPALMVRCMGLPTIRAAQQAMDDAAVAGDLAATTAAARDYYRCWRDTLAQEAPNVETGPA